MVKCALRGALALAHAGAGSDVERSCWRVKSVLTARKQRHGGQRNGADGGYSMADGD